MENTGKEDILLVDDNPENLKILASFLTPKGYHIRVALNGEQAINSINNKPPKLILLDIQMPKMGGFEACRRIKSNKETKDIPIIFVSALSDTTYKVKAFRAGGVDYIEKPFHMEEVIARVEAHITLRRQSVQLEEAMQKLRATQNQLIQSEKMVSLGVLSAGIAHEINNPINFVSTGAAGIKLDLIDLISVLDLYDAINLEKPSSDSVNQLKI
ncbi:MAG: response regulator [Flavobacteriales bacterium]|nr:response regulator [Flavobacteriales bacterium]